MKHLTLTLPDGATRHCQPGTSAAQVATEISVSLGKKAVAVEIDDQLKDLDSVLDANCRLRFVVREDPQALELIRHDLAHIMAQAMQELFPAAQPTIGPVIANGFYYDFFCPETISDDALGQIEKSMRKIVADAIPIRREVWDRAQALEHYRASGEPFKVELVEAIPDGEAISIYRQGDFLDLCRGPHMPSTRHAGTAFKLTSVAGSYWRGDAQGARLQRIYGTAWRDQADLDTYLERLAEAQRRDHRKLGRAMHLFHLQDEAAGSVFWHPQGWTMFRQLEQYMRARQSNAGYLEIRTPQLVDRALWEASGHWAKFRNNMYLVENESGVAEFAKDPDATRVFGLKPMNCPCHVMVFRQGAKSYRDLPLRMAEFGSCHRCEPSGALHGIMRVRAFTQDDAHIFCSPDQIVSETQAFVRLLDTVYRDLGFANYVVKYSDRPAERAGSDQAWDNAEQSLLDACRELDIEYQTNPGEGAFYGPKLEFVLSDALGREWQCGTLQVDFVLPESLGAEYTTTDGQRTHPVILHRAILGSFERFIGILIEHTNGHLPLWLAARQVLIATITSAADAYAQQVAAAFRTRGIRTAVDLRNEKLNYKIREHSAAKVPLIAVLGKQECAQQTVNLRSLGQRSGTTYTLDEAVNLIATKAASPVSGLRQHD